MGKALVSVQKPPRWPKSWPLKFVCNLSRESNFPCKTGGSSEPAFRTVNFLSRRLVSAVPILRDELWH